MAPPNDDQGPGLTDLADLRGLIPAEVGEVLTRYAAHVPIDQAIVEIGSFQGKSACYLAAKAVAHVYAIDAWGLPGNPTGRFGYADAFPKFLAQVALMGFEDRITPIQGFGHKVATNWQGSSVGLLFVDGDHSAAAVKRDVLAWLPHLAVSAVVILDDLDTPKNPGVRVAAKTLSRTLGPFTVQAKRLAVWTL